MAQLVSNKDAFNGTKIDLNGNILTVTLGNSMSVNIGMSNSIFLGSKTQLVTGLMTNITLGPTASFTCGNVLSSTFGYSWIWAPINNTTYDVGTRWGTTRNLICGGTTDTAYAARLTEEKQGEYIALAVLGSYILLVGLTLVGMQWAPFTMNDEDEDGNAEGGVSMDTTNACIAFIVDGLMILAMGFGQWLLTQQFWALRNFAPVSRCNATAAGINCEVYSVPVPGAAFDTYSLPVWGPVTTVKSYLAQTSPGQGVSKDSVLNGKASFVMRPYPGVETPASNPRETPAYAPLVTTDLFVPDIELLATSVLPATAFSQIYMKADLLSLGTGPIITPDTYNTSGTARVLNNNLARTYATGPNIKLDPLTSTVTLKNIPVLPGTPDPNTITIDPMQTSIKRLAGIVQVAVGGTGVENKLVLDNVSATLSTPMGSVAINALGDTTITGGIVQLAKFSATGGVTLMDGTRSGQAWDAMASRINAFYALFG